MAVISAAEGLFKLSSIHNQSEFFPSWWYISALIAFFAMPALAAGLSFLLFVRQIRWLATIVASAQLVVLVTWVPALGGSSMPEAAGPPWIVNLCILPVGFAVLACRGIGIWFFTSAVIGLVVVVRLGSTDQLLPSLGILDALRLGIAMIIGNAVGRSLIRSAHQFDTISAATARAAMDARLGDVINFERARFGALTHDGILDTLLIAGRSRALIGTSLSDQASNVLGQLATLRTDPGKLPDLTGKEFIERQRAAANRVSDRVRFASQETGEARIPATVSAHISGAVGEALRNSIRHADVPGRVVNRAVQVILDDSGAHVFVLDDGAGFVVASVDLSRQGITGSILGGMRALDGGRAEVRSTPGVGTTIALKWSRP
jgi:anti-sigma regulatory factor (Ser/Thr protein kinase)